MLQSATLPSRPRSVRNAGKRIENDLWSPRKKAARPFDGSLLVQNTCVDWRLRASLALSHFGMRLGEDEGLYEKQGENDEPLRPDGGAFVPRCVGDAILKAG